MKKIISIITLLFPIWAIVFSVIAYHYPEWLANQKNLTTPLLMLIMFAMGVTLDINNFTSVFKKPLIIVLGVTLQFTIMPLLAFIISSLFSFNPQLFVGMILLGCAPGGTASNVMSYISKGNTALSVTVTSITTLLGVFITPALVLLLAGNTLPIPAESMILSIGQIVIIPIISGLIVNYFFKSKLDRFNYYCSFIAMLAIVFIIGIIVAASRETIATAGISIVFALLILNILGITLGYWISKLFKCNREDSIALAFEVGMQDSGLSVVLAIKYFTSLAALPSAIYSLLQNIIGSGLASYWLTKHRNKK